MPMRINTPMPGFDGATEWINGGPGDATLARLDEIFPGHKPAPEDYAW